MNNFPQLLQAWQAFYTTIATASATLTGLLFVSLSLNRQILDQPSRLAAQRTFSNLIDVLIDAMFWAVAIIVALLGSASWNVWELLFKA